MSLEKLVDCFVRLIHQLDPDGCTPGGSGIPLTRRGGCSHLMERVLVLFIFFPLLCASSSMPRGEDGHGICRARAAKHHRPRLQLQTGLDGDGEQGSGASTSKRLRWNVCAGGRNSRASLLILRGGAEGQDASDFDPYNPDAYHDQEGECASSHQGIC